MSTRGRYWNRPFSPYKKICEVPLLDIQRTLLNVFRTHGLPECIKVDNGRPFGDPQRQNIPVLVLWLLAFGIKIIFNRPRTPQDNAKVERSQGVLSKWTEWEKCADRFELQYKVWKEADFHNMHYSVSRLGGKTRIQAFDNLLRSPKTFDPSDFDPQRTIDFVAKGLWQREVSKNGQFSFWAQKINVGKKYAHQSVSIKLDPQKNNWQAFDRDGNLLKSFDTNFTAQNLWKLNLCPDCQ